MTKHTISVLVENEFGVLARVASMFAARGYNIDSLSVAPTLDPHYSSMTIVTTGNQTIVGQIIKQLYRLVDVVKVQNLEDENFIQLESLLVKLKSSNTKQAIQTLANQFQTTFIETPRNYILQFTGSQKSIDDLLIQLKSFEVEELIRGGTIAMEK